MDTQITGVLVRMKRLLKARLDRRAYRSGNSINSYAVKAIEEKIERDETTEQAGTADKEKNGEPVNSKFSC